MIIITEFIVMLLLLLNMLWLCWLYSSPHRKYQPSEEHWSWWGALLTSLRSPSLFARRDTTLDWCMTRLIIYARIYWYICHVGVKNILCKRIYSIYILCTCIFISLQTLHYCNCIFYARVYFLRILPPLACLPPSWILAPD